MPKYDHRCKDCGHEWEVTRKHGREAVCPACGSTNCPTIWKSVPILDKAKDPYDLIDGKGQSGGGKKIFSGPKVSSKTTV